MVRGRWRTDRLRDYDYDYGCSYGYGYGSLEEQQPQQERETRHESAGESWAGLLETTARPG